MIFVRSSLLLTLSAVCLLVGFSAQQVSALDYSSIGGRPAYPQEGNARTESIFVHTIEPGETASDGVLLLNNSNAEKTLRVYAVDSINSSDGAFACAQASDEKVSVGAWTTLMASEVTLAAGETQVVPFTIAVPLDASVGESNGCIVIQEKKAETEQQSGINFSFRTGIRIAVTIPGDIVRSIQIESFDHTVAENGIHQLNISTLNSGNVSVDTTIATHVQSLFGTALFDQNGDFPVLRDQSAQWHFELPASFWGGWYRGTLTVSYDASQEASIGVHTNAAQKVLLANTQWFFVAPSQNGMMIEIGILIAVLIVVVAVWIVMHQRKMMRTTWVPYVVKEGEDIQRIASDHAVAWKVLARGNALRAPYAVSAGKALRVPPTSKKIDLTPVNDVPAESKPTKKTPAKKKTQQ